MQITKASFGVVVGLAALAVMALALSNLKQSAAAAPETYRMLPAVKLWPAGAPGAEKLAGRLAVAPGESTDGRNIFNVVDPDRGAAIGLSAGARVVWLMALNADVKARSNYVAAIYGAPFAGNLMAPRNGIPRIPEASAPDKAPPFFIAMAQDDGLAGNQTRALYDGLMKAG